MSSCQVPITHYVVQQPPKKRAKHDSDQIEKMTPEQMKADIFNAVADLQIDKLTQLLAVKMPSLKYNIDGRVRLYGLIVKPTVEKLTYRRAALVECFRVLVADSRFVLPFQIIRHVVKDRRQMIDILDVICQRARGMKSYAERLQYISIEEAMSAENEKIFAHIIAQPFINVNRVFIGHRHTLLLHYLLEWSWQKKTTSMLHSVLVRYDRDCDASLRRPRGILSALRVGDEKYSQEDGRYPDTKKQAARHMRMLLDHDCVDIHSLVQPRAVNRLFKGYPQNEQTGST